MLTVTLKNIPNSEYISFEKPSNNIFEKIKQILFECQKTKNGYVTISFTKPRKPKTTKENGKYWAMCTEYGLYCGLTKEEVSDGVKDRAVAERGYPVTVHPISKIQKPLSISKASTTELSLLIDMLYEIASEDGYIFNEDVLNDKAELYK